jgi:hypothetical protein
MRLFVLASLSCWAVVLFGAASASAAPSADDVAKAEKAVKDYLAKVKGSAAKVEYVKDDAVQLVFPKTLWFSVRFPQYPVGRVPPKGLKASNVFAVGGDGTVTPVTDHKELDKAFGDVKAKSDDTAKTVVRAFVRLTEDLHQDGFYKFALMDDSTKVTTDKGSRTATAKAVVMGGGNGEITAALTFDDAGKLTKSTADAKLKPGPRPICQATKLLDADALVRRMAEQDLLYMGRAAKDYLDEQRAKAGPELRRAIDALWQRICEQDR